MKLKHNSSKDKVSEKPQDLIRETIWGYPYSYSNCGGEIYRTMSNTIGNLVMGQVWDRVWDKIEKSTDEVI